MNKIEDTKLTIIGGKGIFRDFEEETKHTEYVKTKVLNEILRIIEVEKSVNFTNPEQKLVFLEEKIEELKGKKLIEW